MKKSSRDKQAEHLSNSGLTQNYLSLDDNHAILFFAVVCIGKIASEPSEMGAGTCDKFISRHTNCWAGIGQCSHILSLGTGLTSRRRAGRVRRTRSLLGGVQQRFAQ